MKTPHKGLTLIELVITIVVISIIAVFSASSFSWILERNAASATRTNIERTFALARYTAVTERTLVTICPLNNSQSCTHDWSLPTAVFRDPTNALAITDNEQLVKSVALPARGKLTPSNSFNGPRTHFQYQADGTVRGTLGNFTWCPVSGNARSALHVRINFGGRLAWSRDSDGNHIVENTSGTDVTC